MDLVVYHCSQILVLQRSIPVGCVPPAWAYRSCSNSHQMPAPVGVLKWTSLNRSPVMSKNQFDQNLTNNTTLFSNLHYCFPLNVGSEIRWDISSTVHKFKHESIPVGWYHPLAYCPCFWWPRYQMSVLVKGGGPSSEQVSTGHQWLPSDVTSKGFRSRGSHVWWGKAWGRNGQMENPSSP